MHAKNQKEINFLYQKKGIEIRHKAFQGHLSYMVFVINSTEVTKNQSRERFSRFSDTRESKPKQHIYSKIKKSAHVEKSIWWLLGVTINLVMSQMITFLLLSHSPASIHQPLPPQFQPPLPSPKTLHVVFYYTSTQLLITSTKLQNLQILQNNWCHCNKTRFKATPY